MYSETDSASPWLKYLAMETLIILTQILWQNQKQWCAFLGSARQPQRPEAIERTVHRKTLGELWFAAAYTVHP